MKDKKVFETDGRGGVFRDALKNYLFQVTSSETRRRRCSPSSPYYKRRKLFFLSIFFSLFAFFVAGFSAALLEPSALPPSLGNRLLQGFA
jgi:quinol-cytochrome oxidoreductase complex cytochrome b subunit